MKFITALAFASLAAAHPAGGVGPSCGVTAELATKLGSQGIDPSNMAAFPCDKLFDRYLTRLYEDAGRYPEKQDELYGLAGWVEALKASNPA